MSNLPDEATKATYDQLCTSYRAIDDFRAKLLGFLPLATGTGLVVLFGNLSKPTEEAIRLLGPIGIFGFLITLGLFSYEIYGIKKCHALIEAGKRIEEESLGSVGQFKGRPREVAGLVNEPFAAGLIYPTVLAAWAYLALIYTNRQAAAFIALSCLVLGFVTTLIYNKWLARSSKSPASSG